MWVSEKTSSRPFVNRRNGAALGRDVFFRSHLLWFLQRCWRKLGPGEVGSKLGRGRESQAHLRSYALLWGYPDRHTLSVGLRRPGPPDAERPLLPLLPLRHRMGRLVARSSDGGDRSRGLAVVPLPDLPGPWSGRRHVGRPSLSPSWWGASRSIRRGNPRAKRVDGLSAFAGSSRRVVAMEQRHLAWLARSDVLY